MARPGKAQARARRSAARERKRRQERRGAGALLRGVLVALGAALLVLPVLLLAEPVSYVPLLMLLIMVGVSWLYLRVVFRGITVSVGQHDYDCQRGESAALEVSVSNASFLPAPRVELAFVISNLFEQAEEQRLLSCSLAPFQTLTVPFEASFAHLGRYEAGVRSLTVYDLLGVFKRTREDGTMNAVTVRPARVSLGGPVASDAAAEETSSALKAVVSDNEDYASVREYHRGDPMKTIHWNLSSRNVDGKLFTRLFEEYVNPTMVVVLDCCAPAYDEETLLGLYDGMVECAIALAEQARLSGIETELRFLSAEGEEAALRVAGEGTAGELVERLHRIVVAGEESPEALAAADMLRRVGLQSGAYSNVALVSARACDECLSLLRDVAARRKSATVFAALPTWLEGRERERFWEPFEALDSSGVRAYAVESNAYGTEVVGL